MSQKGLTHILAILDRSGSMGSMSEEVINGFNEFIAQQKKVEGEANISLVLFDDRYDVIHSNADIKHIPLLTRDQYHPRGMTAMNDAICKAIDDAGRLISELDDDKKPEKVITLIMTDGEENASQKYKHSDVMQRITHQREKYSWEVMFLGTNIEVERTAASIGIAKGASAGYACSGRGVAQAFNYMSVQSKACRLGVNLDTFSNASDAPDDDGFVNRVLGASNNDDE